MAGTCPSNSIQTFPNSLSLPAVSTATFGSTPYQPLGLTFQWAEQRTPSTFLNSQKGVILPPSGLSNTLRYNGKTYILQKLQLTDASHPTWILPQSQIGNYREDIVFTFVANPEATPVTPAQIIIVVPIFRTATVSSRDPNYLKAMGPIGTYDFATAFSLGDFFPPSKTTTVLTNTLHLYYNVCSGGQETMVVVQVNGITVSNSVMDIVKTALNSVSGLFGAYEPISGSLTPTGVGSINEVTFNRIVKHAFNLGEAINTQPPPAASTEQIEKVDAYKCVPFDPDSQVVDGKIKINTANGEVLSQVNLSREALIKEAKEPSAALESAEKFVKDATYYLGIFIAVAAFMIILYILAMSGGGVGAANETSGMFSRALIGVKTFVMWFFTAIVIGTMPGFLGLIVGLSLR